jgi:Bacteriophage Mu transposase
MYVTISQLLEWGVSQEEIDARLREGRWQRFQAGQTSDLEPAILLSSLPPELQLQWAKQPPTPLSIERLTVLLAETEGRRLAERETEIAELLSHLGSDEREAWLRESLRLARLIERYQRLRPKRHCSRNGRIEFISEIYQFCQEVVCREPLILARQPRLAEVPSPHTLERWSRAYWKGGLLAFLSGMGRSPAGHSGRRRAAISAAAIEWVNAHWRRFRGPRPLYKALKEEAALQGWQAPSESWLYRLWQRMPEIVKTAHLQGQQAYESKHALFVPRDYTDLEALQVLCGDHSERDVTVLLPDGMLKRPWLTVWYDLRTGLIRGWHLDLTPSSVTAGLAYADGVQNFGVQPSARPDEGFFSYVYTDRGRDYRSHHWDGKVIAVHQSAMRIEGGLEFMMVERQIGVLADLQLRHLLARGRNAKEKPVERLFKDLSAWEANLFPEYCGGKPGERPDAWRERYARHQRFLKGQELASPFIRFDEYRERLAGFITRANASPHERPTLRSERLMPVEEYRRLYTTRYEIQPETPALLLLKSDRRIIRKNGVQCFQKHWYYYHEAMSPYKGASVEMRYADGDYNKVAKHFLIIKERLSDCHDYLIQNRQMSPTNNYQDRIIVNRSSFQVRVSFNST